MSAGDKTGKITRRESLAAAGSLLMVGSGLGVVLQAPSARAADEATFLVKIHKHEGKRRKLVATLEISPDLMDKLEASGEEPVSLVVEHNEGTDTKVVGEKEVAGAHKVRTAIRASRRRRK